MFYLYILKCCDHSYYIGSTDDIDERLIAHRTKKYAGYTSTRLPVELVFLETFSNRDDAIRAERQLKGWTRRKKEFLIQHGWEKMQGFWKRDKRVISKTNS